VELASEEAEAAAMAALGAAGFAVAALSRFGCGAPARPGLVVGFADADAARIERFVDILARALAGGAGG
jgi:DNA-binding transcriptional MocR family regulator